MKISKMANRIEPSLTRKLFDMAKKYDNVIDFTLGDPDYETPDYVKKAACDAIMAGKTKYAANAGIIELRKAAAKRIERETGISYDPNAAPAAPEPEGTLPLGDEDFSKNSVTIEEISNDGTTAVYHCTAKGFEGTNEADITVNVAEGKIESIAVTAFGDTVGVGDAATSDSALAAYQGAGIDAVIDATTGASFTSRSVRAMAAAALNTAAGKDPSGMNGGDLPAEGTLGSEDFSENEVICRVWSNIDSSAYVYKCSAKGFEGTNKATITVNKDKGTIVSVAVDEFGDTTGVGDAATADAELAKFEGASLDSAIDATSGASLTSKSLRAMAAAALQAAGN